MRKIVLGFLVAVPVMALAVTGPLLLGHALFALGFTALSTRFLGDPEWRGYALASAGKYREAAAAFGEGKVSAYNRGNALAHAGLYSQAIDAYDQALEADPEDEDARFNKALVTELLDTEGAAGDAKGNANAASTREGQHGTHGDQEGKTNSTGIGFVGNKEGASTSGSQGGNKVSKVGRGEAQATESSSGKASGSAGFAAGRGRQGGDLADVTAQIAANQRHFLPNHTAQTIRPDVEWLQTVRDDPGRFLKLQIRAEQKRRLARSGSPGRDDD